MFDFFVNGIDVCHKLDASPLTVPEIARHYHSMLEIFYFVGGDAYINVEGYVTQLCQGDVIFIRPGQHHIITLDRQTPYDRYVLKFRAGFVPEHITSRINEGTAFFHADEHITNIFEGLDGLYEKFYGQDLFVMFACRINELAILLSRAERTQKAWEHDAFVTDIIDYIKANLCGELSLDDLCKAFGRSRSYIGSRFGRAMQTPLMQYVRTKKMIAAMDDISRGGKPAEVAVKYGFYDYSAFYRAYTKAVGLPPRSGCGIDTSQSIAVYKS